MAKITRLSPPKALPKKKRVAAYARVSLETSNLLRSFANQVNHYSDLIQSRSDWTFVGVYADRGLSGTKISSRDEFKHLLRDCENGQIDLILTKSVSRFARNTIDTLTTVRHLKEIGVEVYFEEQNISTLSADGELMLSLVAAVAQEEVSSIKNNVEWLIVKKFEEGIPNGYKRMLGYDWDGEKYIIVPDEAKIVKRIFEMYSNGNSSVAIAKILNSEGAVNVLGKPFTDSNVRYVLENEDYTGTLILQKRYSPVAGKRAKNRGEVPMYRVEDAHEGIISEELFAEVTRIRREKAASKSAKEITCFSGKLKCGYCGSAVCRRNVSKRKPAWICNKIDKKGISTCEGNRRLSEIELTETVATVLGDNYETEIDAQVDFIDVYDDKLVFHFYSGKAKTVERHFPSGSHERSCFTKKIYCTDCGEVLWRRKAKNSYDAVWICKNSCGKYISEDELMTAIREIFGKKENYDMRFYTNTEKVLMFDNQLDFYMKDGRITIWQRK